MVERLNRRKNLVPIGTMYNSWKVLEHKWVNGSHYCTCLCTDCNKTIKDVLYKNLKTNKSKSCGCNSKGHDMISHVTEKWGRLYIFNDYMKDKIHWCDCYCDCDKDKPQEERKVVTVRWGDIKNGSTRSCGCYHKDRASETSTHNLKGKYFGYIEVLYRNGSTKDGNAIWHCKCHAPNCGNEKDIPEARLDENTVSCGCMSHIRPLPLEYVGQTYNYLTIIGMRRKYGDYGELIFKCRCNNCKNHTVLEVQANNVLNGHTKSCGCLSIGVVGSHCENEIKDYITSISGKIGKKVNILGRKQIDLYYEDMKFGIEYNGSFYHATENALHDNKDKYYHRNKFLQAKEKGIHLVNIFDIDWLYRKEKVKRYLDNIFKPKERIYARNCEVKQIDRKIADNFCDMYHLQNHALMGKICYGLYYKEELYAVMTFGNARFSKADDYRYELHRYCVKSGIVIVGGANKLLKAFENEYKPKYLVSYSDNDYFSGDIYEKLGFNNEGQCDPRYYWIYDKGKKEFRREQCRLSLLKNRFPVLYEEAMSDKNIKNKETYIMVNSGACKVYRSGNTKWLKSYLY